ncbi:ferredoxin-thioredoxin reductase catalytic chain [Thermostichus sp. MS-CIW-40]
MELIESRPPTRLYWLREASSEKAVSPIASNSRLVPLLGIVMESRGYKKSSQKSFELMRHFAETYAKRSETFFCSDPSITTAVIEGLALHKEQLGAPLCPCRFYEDKEAEAKAGYWNCPCVPMRERKECHCMLFLTPDNPFAGKSQTLEEVPLEYQTTK